ncbi:GRAS family protein RAM1-like [Rutidosis leptorrhynchoides]|uniref:GRAS family protein RAM1-like n=1 Tax=Rutidosis leptorrhynchoides TaxID=125765 RepID=UPI003A9988CF
MSATCLDDNKLDSTVEFLMELYRYVSLNGNSVQRVAAYFAEGLLARLLTRRSPFHEMIMKQPGPTDELLAYVELYKVSPYYQFAHFTANQMIMEAFERDLEINNDKNHCSLYVVDLDVAYGFQWPSLMQSLSEKATNGNHASLRITGFGKTLDELEETKARLVGFAKTFKNLIFEFRGIPRTNSYLESIRKRKNETLVVNSVFYLNSLCNLIQISKTLKSIHVMRPSLVVLVEQEGGRSPRSFLSRFMEFLHYYAAMFDSLDDFLPLDSVQRLQIETNHLGKEIKQIMNFDTNKENSPKYEKMETWKARMESHRFVGMNLSSKSIIQAKLLLKISSNYSPIQFDGENNGGFSAFERQENAISLAWQDKCLITASAWQCI